MSPSQRFPSTFMAMSSYSWKSARQEVNKSLIDLKCNPCRGPDIDVTLRRVRVSRGWSSPAWTEARGNEAQSTRNIAHDAFLVVFIRQRESTHQTRRPAANKDFSSFARTHIFRPP